MQAAELEQLQHLLLYGARTPNWSKHDQVYQPNPTRLSFEVMSVPQLLLHADTTLLQAMRYAHYLPLSIAAHHFEIPDIPW